MKHLLVLTLCFLAFGCAHHSVTPLQEEINASSAISSTMTLSQKIEAESKYLESH